MKKILSLLCGSLIVLLMFAAPGNPVQAEEEPCICGDIITQEILGAERNKIISNLLKSDEFKTIKKVQMQHGLKWNGVNNIVVENVIINDKDGNFITSFIAIAAPFYDQDGTLNMAVFFNGEFQGIAPEGNHEH
jgi:hypothetical protein